MGRSVIAWSLGVAVACVGAGAAATTVLWTAAPPVTIQPSPDSLPSVDLAASAPELPSPLLGEDFAEVAPAPDPAFLAFELVTLFDPARAGGSGYALRSAFSELPFDLPVARLDTPPADVGAASPAVRDIIRRETAGRDTTLSRLSVLPPPRPAFAEPRPAAGTITELASLDPSAPAIDARAAPAPSWPWSLPFIPQAGNEAGGRALGSGIASWYGPGFHGRRTASGERFDQHALTAAHRNLPFGTRVRVVDQRTGRSIVVRINDRGPFAHGRVIDLSKASAEALGLRGLARVQIVSAE